MGPPASLVNALQDELEDIEIYLDDGRAFDRHGNEVPTTRLERVKTIVAALSAETEGARQARMGVERIQVDIIAYRSGIKELLDEHRESPDIEALMMGLEDLLERLD